uniref:Delta-coixin n=1 Tax=Coix lacryma-jobi TaxID=4505 RepID=C0L973_COILA|nr:delta-coixin [Coix lacryma-jobi]
MASQTTKMLALVVLLALSTIATATTTCLQNAPRMMGMTMVDPCMQSCMMQQSLAMAISSPSLVMGMNSVVSCMQSCMMQHAFAIGGSSLPTVVMQRQPFTMAQQQCCMQPMMMQGVMSPLCHCGVVCQMMQLQQMRMEAQLPSMCSATAMPILAAYAQRPFPCCAF